MQNQAQLVSETQRSSFEPKVTCATFHNFSVGEKVYQSSKVYSPEFLHSLRHRCTRKFEGIPRLLIRHKKETYCPIAKVPQSKNTQKIVKTYSRSFLLSLRSSCNGEVKNVPDFLKKKTIPQPKPEPKKISLSIRDEVALQKAENAWKPRNLSSTSSNASLEVHKKFRSVLNKLTPEKFDKLLNQLLELDISTEERATEVVNILYEKAVSEQSFSELYARLCKELPGASFRKLLVNKCRTEFKKIYTDAAEVDQKTRIRHVGNVRFVGELYKQGLLTRMIVTTCLERLEQNGNETNLECLSKLLWTVGWTVEIKESYNLSECFYKLRLLSTNLKLSSRIRFMIRDVMDFRYRMWSLEK